MAVLAGLAEGPGRRLARRARPRDAPDAERLPERPARGDGARGLGRVLRRFIVGAADLNKRRTRGASIPATVFGERADLPSWPARFATRLGIPIVPVPAALGDDGEFVCHAADPIDERDPEAATQAWASAFEGFFRRWPEDWAFAYDKRWSALIRRAAAARRAGEGGVPANEVLALGRGEVA